jgi:SAM-dependent methyltransferase
MMRRGAPAKNQAVVRGPVRLAPTLAALRRRRRPLVLGSLGSTRPVSNAWGYDRGLPVDRYYIERFLDEHRADITGTVAEVKDRGYADRFGHRLERVTVIDIDAANPAATLVADLGVPGTLPERAFDCVILTQTLQYVLDLPAAVGNLHASLRPGGVLLVTVPVVSRLCTPPLTDYWRLMPAAVEALLSGPFGSIAVTAPGNVLAQVAFLAGLAAEDLTRSELDDDDSRFPIVVTARAVRAA